ncbi:MAG: glycosyltransferase [Dermatophilaceae bacterium]
MILTCRNAAASIGQTLESLTGQRYPGWWEVIVVDNASTDATGEIARGFADRLSTLRVLRADPPGRHAPGANFGVARSRGEVLVFLDGDDIVEPGYLDEMGSALAMHPFAGSRLAVGSVNDELVRSRRKPLQQSHLEVFWGFRPAVIGAGLGMRREAFDQIGGFDVELNTLHDIDASFRLVGAGYQPTFVPDAVVHYRYRNNVNDTFRQEFGYGRGEAAVYRKYRDEGMGRRGPLRVAAWWSRTALAVARVPLGGNPWEAATLLGHHLGRVRGSMKERVLYL